MGSHSNVREATNAYIFSVRLNTTNNSAPIEGFHLNLTQVSMSVDRTVKKVFLGKPDGKRKVCRPKLRWLQCIENDLQSIGVKRWRKKAEDRSLWVIILHEALVKLYGPYAKKKEGEAMVLKFLDIYHVCLKSRTNSWHFIRKHTYVCNNTPLTANRHSSVDIVTSGQGTGPRKSGYRAQGSGNDNFLFAKASGPALAHATSSYLLSIKGSTPQVKTVEAST
jgi:hypothetical protein